MGPRSGERGFVEWPLGVRGDHGYTPGHKISKDAQTWAQEVKFGQTLPAKERKRLKILPERKLCSWGPHRRGDRRRILPGPELGKWGRRWRSSGASPPPPPHQSPPRGSHPPLLEAQHSEPDILGALPLPGNGSTGRRAPPDIGRSRNFPLEQMLTMTSPCTGRNLGLGIISDLK